MRALPLLVFTPMALTAQIAVPLKNWTAPQYFQPNQAERANISKAGAEIQFSPNATSNTALVFVAVSPCRLVDTRGASAGFIGATPFSGPYIQAGQTVAFPIQSATETNTDGPSPCGAIPSTAQAYSLNLTLVPHPLGTPVNFVTMWPDNGSAIPTVSTVNDQQGAIVANSAIVPAGTNSGGIKVYVYGATDIIVDMNGFYAAPTDLSSNTAIGAGTLVSNTTGYDNTATGQAALQNNTTGANNAATGADALENNTAGTANTADGYAALLNNTTGSFNTATGTSALASNTTGGYNTASGVGALQASTSGNYNTATGYWALHSDTQGLENTAFGYEALQNNSSAGGNTAVGYEALQNNTGYNNIAIGAAAGLLNTSGNENIYIGSSGSAADIDGTIRIGNPGIASLVFVQGIYSESSAGGVPVYINSNGQLGTVSSSARFKDDIHNMADASSRLMQLRPVTFRYKKPYADGSKPLEYGLIAEEVEKVYPEMVAYDSDGQIMTVKYQMLAPMLLNEVQKQNAELKRQVQLQQEENRRLEEQSHRQSEENRSIEERLAALEALLAGQAPAVARTAGTQ